jgi:uncharacterized protein YqjF (DUF2071 family)
MGVVGARARDVCFAHVPVDPEVLDTRLPHALSVATRDDVGWVTLLGMRTQPLSGAVGLPWSFAQVTVRTYVEAGGEEAVYFLRVDVDSRAVAALGRRLFGVSVQHTDASVTVEGGEVDVRTHAPGGRPLYVASFPVDDDVDPVPAGSLDAWLTDRSRFALEDGRTGEVVHGPWRVAPVNCNVLRNALLSSEGLPEPVDDLLFRYSPGADVHFTGWPSSA